MVVLVGLLPTGAFRDPHAVIQVVLAAMLFQAVASGGYLFNDCLDVRRDRLHPRKRMRPIASGAIAPPAALAAAALIALGAIGLGALITPYLSLVLSCYAVVTVAYSLVLKHVVVCDIMTIAAIFVLRAVTGVVVIGAYVSPWFLISVGCLALLLALGKRLGEARLLSETQRVHRITLRAYQHAGWGRMLVVVAGLTVACYLIAASLSPTAHLHPLVLLTTIPVFCGVWRYTRLVRAGGGGEPERLLLRDVPMAVCACAWAALLAIAVML